MNDEPNIEPNIGELTYAITRNGLMHDSGFSLAAAIQSVKSLSEQHPSDTWIVVDCYGRKEYEVAATMPAEKRRLLRTGDRPFPWRCGDCGAIAVYRTRRHYKSVIKKQGRSYDLEIPDLEVPVCEKCGEMVFDNHAGNQLHIALEILVSRRGGSK